MNEARALSRFHSKKIHENAKFTNLIKNTPIGRDYEKSMSGRETGGWETDAAASGYRTVS
jgi:hypothetical protein